MIAHVQAISVMVTRFRFVISVIDTLVTQYMRISTAFNFLKILEKR